MLRLLFSALRCSRLTPLAPSPRLGDHDDWGKSQPWQGSASVPFVIAAPSPALRSALNLASNATVDAPVATIDIGGTALDFANASAVANMTTQSLRPLLITQGGNATPPRAFVSSGLAQWRLVVMTHPANGHALKLVCCSGPCPGQPTANSSYSRGFVDSEWAAIGQLQHWPARAPDSTQGSRDASAASSGSTTAWTKLLYDTTVDPFDTTDVSSTYPHAVQVMTQLLPPGWCGRAGA